MLRYHVRAVNRSGPRGVRWMAMPLVVATTVALLAASAGAEEEAADGPPPPPASSPLAKIEKGMSEGQVMEILGSPQSKGSYSTGKGHIPFYYGSDKRRRMWQYKGMGRVVFSKGSFTRYKVIGVEYNPDELDGVDVSRDVGNPVVVPPTPRPWRRPPRPF